MTGSVVRPKNLIVEVYLSFHFSFSGTFCLIGYIVYEFHFKIGKGVLENTCYNKSMLDVMGVFRTIAI